MNTNHTQDNNTQYAQQGQQPPHYGPQYGPNGPNSSHKPDSYLILSIISTLFGCFPLGIVAIIYATQVDNLYYQGNFAGALNAANNAKRWSIISLVCAASVVCLWILAVVLIATGAIVSLPTLL